MKSKTRVCAGLFLFFIVLISAFPPIPLFQTARAESEATGEPSSEDPDARQWARPSLYKKGRAKTVITNIHGLRIVNIRYVDLEDDEASTGPGNRSGSLSDLLARLVRTHEIEFRPGSTTLTEDAKRVLDQAVIMFSRFPEPRFEVEAYTDSYGSEFINLKLSQKRAERVVRYLERSGVRKGRLVGKGYGETRPIASNSTKKDAVRTAGYDSAKLTNVNGFAEHFIVIDSRDSDSSSHRMQTVIPEAVFIPDI